MAMGYQLPSRNSLNVPSSLIAEKDMAWPLKPSMATISSRYTGPFPKHAAEMRKTPRPLLLECMTFRRRGHEEASGTKYVPDELMSYWEERDPVERYEEFLLSEGVLSSSGVQSIREEYKTAIEENLETSYSDKPTSASPLAELDDVYAESRSESGTASTNTKELRFVDAIAEGLDVANGNA